MNSRRALSMNLQTKNWRPQYKQGSTGSFLTASYKNLQTKNWRMRYRSSVPQWVYRSGTLVNLQTKNWRKSATGLYSFWCLLESSNKELKRWGVLGIALRSVTPTESSNKELKLYTHFYLGDILEGSIQESSNKELKPFATSCPDPKATPMSGIFKQRTEAYSYYIQLGVDWE